MRYDRENDPRLDPDKWPDTPAQFIVHRGIKTESRYRKNHEFGAMAAIVDAFFENAAVRPETDLIEGIWCDSKATNTYSIWIRNNNRRVAEMLADAAEGALIRNSGGHNGISINLDRMFGETLAHRDPWWLYDEQE
jgi:hypothetical protein